MKLLSTQCNPDQPMQWNLQDMGLLSMSADPAEAPKPLEGEQKEPGDNEEGDGEVTVNPNAERYSTLIKVHRISAVYENRRAPAKMWFRNILLSLYNLFEE